MVENLKDIIVKLFELLATGETVSKIIISAKGKGTNKPLLGITLLACNQCDWKTRTRPALKAHITRLHGGPEDMVNHKNLAHNNVRLRANVNSNLKRSRSIKSTKDTSPAISPPKKKHIIEKKIEDAIEMVDMSETVNLKKTEENEIHKLKLFYEKKIAKLELIVKKHLEERKQSDDNMDTEENKPTDSETTQATKVEPKNSDFGSVSFIDNIEVEKEPIEPKKVVLTKISAPLVNVHEEHIPLLRGFTKRLCGIADGDCTTNCATAHIFHTEVKDERKKMKKRMNHLIADNWDNFFHNKIPLPFKETVGVGKNRWDFEAKTKEEMVAFLKSNRSLGVFTDTPHILALACHLNTNVEIFSYGIHNDKNRCEWNLVQPDPAMEHVAMFPKGFIDTLFLYHSDDNHYDLLVKDDHKLVTEGLTVAKVVEEKKGDIWTKVKKRKHQEVRMNEKIEAAETVKDLSEEQKLANSKAIGHKRTGPQTEADALKETKSKPMIRCAWTEGSMQCTIVLESEGLVNAHMKTHRSQKPPIRYCDMCDEEFHNTKDLWKHNKDEHDTSRRSIEWNCHDCDFQSTSSPPLMNHCKEEGHQPSSTIQDTRNRIIKCNTCDLEFTSYWNMMNHRKQMHPSNRKCRNFPGNCKHAELCWYVHDESMMELDSESQEPQPEEAQVKCYVCNKVFNSRNELMNHRKREHPSFILCKDFLSGNCRRSEKECWYIHQTFLPRHVTTSNVSSNIVNSNPLSQSRQDIQAPPPHATFSSVSSNILNTNPLSQSRQNGQAPPAHVIPSGAASNILNTNPLSQTRQNIQTPVHLPPSAIVGASPSLSVPLLRQHVNPPGEGFGGVRTTSPLSQSPQVNQKQDFQIHSLTPRPPEVPVMMLQLTQMMQRMENMERNFQMIVHNMSQTKSLST